MAAIVLRPAKSPPSAKPESRGGWRLRTLEGLHPERLETDRASLLTVGEPVTCVLALPAGDRALIGTASGRLLDFHPTQGGFGEPILAHADGVRGLSVSADGKTILSWGGDGTLSLWSDDLEPILTVERCRITAASISPDGKRFAYAESHGRLVLRKTVDAEILGELSGPDEETSACRLLPNGEFLTGTSGGISASWSFELRRLLRANRGHTGPIVTIESQAGAAWYLTGSSDGQVRFWNGRHKEAGRDPWSLPPISSGCFADGGRLFLTTHGDGQLRAFDVATGRERDSFDAGLGPLVGLAVFERDRLVTAFSANGAVARFPLDAIGRIDWVHRHAGDVYALVSSLDNVGLLSAGHDGRIRIWDRATRGESAVLDLGRGPQTALEPAPDGVNLGIGGADGMIRLWSTRSNRLELEMAAHKAPISALRFLGDGTYLLSSGWDGKIHLWNLLKARRVATFDGHSREVAGIEVAADERRFYSAGWDGLLLAWDLGSFRSGVGKELIRWETPALPMLSLALRPDGDELVTGGADGQLRFGPARHAGNAVAISRHRTEITWCRYRHDGSLLLAADRLGVVSATGVSSKRKLGGDSSDSANRTPPPNPDSFPSLDDEVLDSPVSAGMISLDGRLAAFGHQDGRVSWMSIPSDAGPGWLVADTIRKPGSILLGGGHNDVHPLVCTICGREERLRPNQLGKPWTCSGCRANWNLHATARRHELNY
jgi:WD40 repeat protein